MGTARGSMIGRRAERRWLLERLRRAHDGSPQCVLLSGPAGIGKTRLAAEARVEARELGFATLLGRAHEGVGVPLLVFRDGVLPGVARLLDDGSGLPAPVAALHTLTSEPSERTDAVATMLLVELAELIVAACAREPLCIVLDDLHWADSSSIALVRHLLDRLESRLGAVRLFVLVVTRPDASVASLMAEPFCARLELGPLDQLETIELARELGAVNVAIRSVFDETHGSPLLIESFARSSAGLSQQLRAESAFDTSFAMLSPTTIEVLERAALLVPDIDLDTLSRVGPWSPHALSEAIDEAVLAGLMVVDGGGLRFSHPMARERCLRDLGPNRRARLHAEIAGALGAPEGAKLLAVARHLVLAGREADADLVATVAKAAATQACATCAWAEAGELFEAGIAAEHRRGGEVSSELAAAHLSAGMCRQRALDVDAALEHFEQAAWYSETIGDVLVETRARTEQLILRVGAGGAPDADVEVVKELAARVESTAPDAAAEALNDVSQAQWASFRIADAQRTIGHVLELAARNGLDHAAAKAYVSRAITRWFSVDLDGALADIDLAVRALEHTDDRWRRALPLYRRPLTLIWLGRTDEASQAVQLADDFAHDVGSFYEYGLVLAARVALALIRGDVARAEADADQALRLEALSAYRWAAQLLLPALVYAYAARDDNGSARWAFDAWHARADPRAGLFVDLMRGRLERETTETGVRKALDAVRWLTSEPFLGAEDLAVLCVETLADSDETAAARRAAELIDATRARGMVLSSTLNVVLDRAAGDAHALGGDPDTARSRYRAAAGIAARVGAIGERGRALLGLARLDAATDRTAAATHLRRALPDLESAQLVRPLARAHVLAEQLGMDLRRDTGATVVSEEATVVFVDVVDSTRLTEHFGDVEYRARQRSLERNLRLAIAEHRGAAVPGINLGDGLLALFDDPHHAIVAAFGAVEAAAPGELRLHVGLHHGRVLRDENLVSGAAVNVAARICAASSPDEVLVSETMRDLLTGTTPTRIRFVDRGVHLLKGVADAHHLFAALPNR